MTVPPDVELKKRAGRALIAHAFFRLESALTISLTILLAFFVRLPWPWWHWWYWALLGSVAEILIIYTSLTDQSTANQVVGDLLRQNYEPNQVRTPRYRQQVERALTYRQQIERAIAVIPAGVLRDHLHDSTAGIAAWMDYIFDLAKRLDTYARDELLHRDMNDLPASIERLRRAEAQESDPAVREQIRAALAAKEAQATSLHALQNQMEQAEFRLEESVTSLGTVYSQFQLINAQKLGGADARRLADSIHDQVQRLQDLIASMNQVYGTP